MVNKVKAELVTRWSKRGYEVSEISKLLGIGEDECRSILTHPEITETSSRLKSDLRSEFIGPLSE